MLSRRYIRIKAFQHLYAYQMHKNWGTIAHFSEKKIPPKSLLSGTRKEILGDFEAILALFLQWQSIARGEERPNEKSLLLFANKWLNDLASEPDYKRLLAHRRYLWEKVDVTLSYSRLIGKWGKTIEERSSDGEKIAHLLRTFFKDDAMQKEMAQRDRIWHQNKPIVFLKLKEFIKTSEKKEWSDAFDRLLKPIPIDDYAFFSDLIEGTKKKETDHKKWLEVYCKNWSLDRISPVDFVLLSMAFFELSSGVLPTPIVVNEYLEIAKKYSTPESARFIHGFLHTFSKEKMGKKRND